MGSSRFVATAKICQLETYLQLTKFNSFLTYQHRFLFSGLLWKRQEHMIHPDWYWKRFIIIPATSLRFSLSMPHDDHDCNGNTILGYWWRLVNIWCRCKVCLRSLTEEYNLVKSKLITEWHTERTERLQMHQLAVCRPFFAIQNSPPGYVWCVGHGIKITINVSHYHSSCSSGRRKFFTKELGECDRFC